MTSQLYRERVVELNHNCVNKISRILVGIGGLRWALGCIVWQWALALGGRQRSALEEIWRDGQRQTPWSPATDASASGLRFKAIGSL